MAKSGITADSNQEALNEEVKQRTNSLVRKSDTISVVAGRNQRGFDGEGTEGTNA